MKITVHGGQAWVLHEEETIEIYFFSLLSSNRLKILKRKHSIMRILRRKTDDLTSVEEINNVEKYGTSTSMFNIYTGKGRVTDIGIWKESGTHVLRINKT